MQRTDSTRYEILVLDDGFILQNVIQNAVNILVVILKIKIP